MAIAKIEIDRRTIPQAIAATRGPPSPAGHGLVWHSIGAEATMNQRRHQQREPTTVTTTGDRTTMAGRLRRLTLCIIVCMCFSRFGEIEFQSPGHTSHIPVRQFACPPVCQFASILCWLMLTLVFLPRQIGTLLWLALYVRADVCIGRARGRDRRGVGGGISAIVCTWRYCPPSGSDIADFSQPPLRPLHDSLHHSRSRL